MPSISDQANEVYVKVSGEWGAFRRWLARHPLTGFWCAVGGGIVLGGIIARVRWGIL